MKDDFYSLYCEAVEENERLKKRKQEFKDPGRFSYQKGPIS